METTTSQPLIFMIAIYGGMLVGVAYDFYRGVRRALNKGRWLTAALDSLFILTLGAIVVYVMYLVNQVELRLYTFIGFAVGFALYMAGISPFLSYVAKKIQSAIAKRKPK